MVLAAFKADALELEYFVWNKGITTLNQINANCTQDPNTGLCNYDLHYTRPERDTVAALQSDVSLEAAERAPSRPTILVWHFQEVAAFMKAACNALNSDRQIIAAAREGTNCSAYLPFWPPS
jgi:hypothetical protein